MPSSPSSRRPTDSRSSGSSSTVATGSRPTSRGPRGKDTAPTPAGPPARAALLPASSPRSACSLAARAGSSADRRRRADRPRRRPAQSTSPYAAEDLDEERVQWLEQVAKACAVAPTLEHGIRSILRRGRRRGPSGSRTAMMHRAGRTSRSSVTSAPISSSSQPLRRANMRIVVTTHEASAAGSSSSGVGAVSSPPRSSGSSVSSQWRSLTRVRCLRVSVDDVTVAVSMVVVPPTGHPRGRGRRRHRDFTLPHGRGNPRLRHTPRSRRPVNRPTPTPTATGTPEVTPSG